MSATALLVFARCAGFAFRAPGFSHPSVPRPLRAGIAMLLAIILSPGVRAKVPANDSTFAIFVVVEFCIGSAIGTVAALLYDGAYAGGRMLDDYVGVKAIAPNIELVAPSGFGRIWSLAFTGGYFLLGGYRAVLLALAASFARIPPGASVETHALGAFAASLATTIVLVAVGVAAPGIALAFVVQIALGALSRTIPRFGTFALSFPLVFGAVLVASALALPLLVLHAGTPVLYFPGSSP